MNFKVGDLVKFACWTGRIVDVYESEDGDTVAKIAYLKDAHKQNGWHQEFIDSDLIANLEPATKQDMLNEWKEIQAKQQERFLALIDDRKE